MNIIFECTEFSAYLLASAALSSFYGKISDLVGRKWVLFPVIVIFLVSHVNVQHPLDKDTVCLDVIRFL